MAPRPSPIAVEPRLPIAIPSWASSKLTALISAPAPKASTRPIWRSGHLRMNASSAPMISEEAARVPHPSAGSMG